MVYLTDPQTNKELTKLFKPKTLNKNKMGEIKGMSVKAQQHMKENKKMVEEEETKEEETKEEETKTPDPVEYGAKEAEEETSEETSEEKPAE